MTPLWAIALMIGVSLVSAYATFNIKLASAKISKNIIQTLKTKRLWIGIFLYGFAMIPSLFAMKFGELSVLYPIVALQYVWTVVLSRKYLGEKIKAMKWIGIAMIIFGVALIGFGAR